MASVSVVFRKEKLNKKGEAPIHLRIIKDRKINFITTGIMLPKKFWDEKNRKIKSGFPNCRRLNSFISNKFTELQDQVFEHETITKSLSTRQLKEKIYGVKPTDFFSFADEAVNRYLQSDQIATYLRGRGIIKKLKAYCEGREMMFQDITVQFLSKYESHLRSVYHNHTNTIHKDFKFLRKLFNDACRLDLIELQHVPFNRYQVKKETTQREFLNEEELSRIENFEVAPGSKLQLYRDMFIFASYAGGLRVSDLLQLRWKNFDGSHIHLSIRKTGTQLSFKLPERALEIIEYYKHEVTPDSEHFIFPVLPNDLDMKNASLVFRQIAMATNYINKGLKTIAQETGIEKPLSFHISRHTWATRALRKGISIDKVSKIMGHAAIHETQIYAKIVNEELDKAMDIFND